MFTGVARPVQRQKTSKSSLTYTESLPVKEPNVKSFITWFSLFHLSTAALNEDNEIKAVEEDLPGLMLVLSFLRRKSYRICEIPASLFYMGKA